MNNFHNKLYMYYGQIKYFWFWFWFWGLNIILIWGADLCAIFRLCSILGPHMQTTKIYNPLAILDSTVWPTFHMCKEPINIILFCESAHRKIIKSNEFWELYPCVWWKTWVKLTKLNGGNLILFLLKCLEIY